MVQVRLHIGFKVLLSIDPLLIQTGLRAHLLDGLEHQKKLRDLIHLIFVVLYTHHCGVM